MSQTNSDILRNYYEEVFNQRRLDRLPVYLSEQYIGYGTPYVGLGIFPDDSSKDKVTIKAIYPGSPADSHLQVGDEVFRVQDGERSLKTFDELSQSPWGQGVLGTPITVAVRRAGKELEFTLRRGLVQGFQFPYKLVQSSLASFFEEFDEYQIHLIRTVEAGDMVGYYCENQGHNKRYNRSAVWGGSGIIRFQGGKIIEDWGSEDTHAQMRQLGYTILEPTAVKA